VKVVPARLTGSTPVLHPLHNGPAGKRRLDRRQRGGETLEVMVKPLAGSGRRDHCRALFPPLERAPPMMTGRATAGRSRERQDLGARCNRQQAEDEGLLSRTVAGGPRPGQEWKS
jgi:hypothetical protein